MRILIKSRRAIEHIANKPFEPGTALISITDHGGDFAALAHKPEFVLRLAFDDVDSDVFKDELTHAPTGPERRQLEAKYHMLSDSQAARIVRFYNEHRERIQTLICQCEYGQSRSAAIAAAILEHEQGKGIAVFAHEDYYPNKFVFRKVLKHLQSSVK